MDFSRRFQSAVQAFLTTRATALSPFESAVQAFLVPRITASNPYRSSSRRLSKKTTPSLVPPASVYAQVAANYSALTSMQKQQLMWWLYKTNIATKSIVRLVSNPIIGDTGFSIKAPESMPETQKVIDEYFRFNRLSVRREQRRHLRGYINTGELCFLTAPYANTWYSVYCSSLLIRHVLLDPLNFEEVIAVVLESDFMHGQTYMYKTITDDSRLSEPARIIRKSLPYSCFFMANFEHDEVETTTISFENIKISQELQALGKKYDFDTWQWLQTQRRGEPFFATWADLFNQLIEVLWAMLDKTKSWGAFNYHFEIDTKVPDFDSSVAKVQQWQDAIGTPDMNSAIYTDQSVKVNPMNFPMQSNDIQKILDTLLQVTGMSGNVTPYDLGANLSHAFATARAQGGPQEAFQVSLQSDMEDYYMEHADFVASDAARLGLIPQEEMQYLHENA